MKRTLLSVTLSFVMG